MNASLLLTLSIVGMGMALPSVDFIEQFARRHERTSVTFHLPPMSHLTAIAKHRTTMMQSNFPSAYVFQGIGRLRFGETDLHVFILDPIKWKQSLKKFVDMYNNRTRTSREYWLVHLGSDMAFEDFSQALSSQGIQVDLDDDLFVTYYVNEKFLQIKELYKIKPEADFELIILPYGNYTSETGLVLDPHEKWARRRNLQGVLLKTVALESVPYITAMTPVQGQPGFFHMDGMFAEVYFSLQEIMNFTFTLIQPPDMQWGALQPDGSWSGIVNLLQTQQVDIAATDFTVTRARSEVITFAQPITQIYHSLFIQNPSGAFNYMAYVEPLHYLAWIAVGTFCLVTPPFMFFTARYGIYEPSNAEFTWGKSVIFVASAITMRGWSVVPEKISGQIVFAVLFYASILLYYHWEAMLISYLATRVIVLPFNNIKELVDQSTFVISLFPGSSYMDAFKFSEDPDWQRAWKQRLEPYLDNYEDTSRMINYPLQDSNVALYDNFFAASAFPEYADCQLIAIPAKYDFKPYAYGLQKDSPFLGIFNHYLRELREKGALKQIANKYESGEQVCPDMSGQPLGFDSCFTAFLALIGGFTIGLILMILEFVSGHEKSIPFLDSYGEPKSNETLDLEQMTNMLAYKNSKIEDLKLKILHLESKLHSTQNKIA